MDNKNNFDKEKLVNHLNNADNFKGTRVNNNSKENNRSNNSYGYYSNILKRPFDTLEELKTAEAALAKERADRELAKSERKAAAKVVEDSFKAYNDAKKNYNDKIREAKRDYLKKQTELHDAYNATVKQYQKRIDEAESAYSKELTKFTEKFGSFHTILEDGDHVIEIDYKTNNGMLDGVLDLFSTLFDKFPF